MIFIIVLLNVLSEKSNEANIVTYNRTDEVLEKDSTINITGETLSESLVSDADDANIPLKDKGKV